MPLSPLPLVIEDHDLAIRLIEARDRAEEARRRARSLERAARDAKRTAGQLTRVYEDLVLQARGQMTLFTHHEPPIPSDRRALRPEAHEEADNDNSNNHPPVQ